MCRACGRTPANLITQVQVAINPVNLDAIKSSQRRFLCGLPVVLDDVRPQFPRHEARAAPKFRPEDLDESALYLYSWKFAISNGAFG